MTREQYIARRNQLMSEAKGFLDAEYIEQFNAKKKEVEELDAKFQSEAEAQANSAALQASPVIPAAMQNLGAGSPVSSDHGTDPFDSSEYKNAFWNFAAKHQPIPGKFLNAAESTTAADVPAAIPTSWVNEIIRNLKERGVIFQSLRRMNVAGGVEIPILDLCPTAAWVGDNASEDKKLTASQTVSFKYHGLECKISQSILVGAVTLEAFQDLFIELATEAVIAAIEQGVFTGTGNGQMLGVCKDPRVTKVVEMTDAEFSSFAAWKKKVFALIPKKYQGGKFYMAQGTHEGYIDGMVDSVGQPVARTNWGSGTAPEYRFGGKGVETVEDDVIAPYDTAAAGDVVAVYMNPKDYILNSSMQMTVVVWVDHNDNKKKTKVMLVCDGKAGDTNGIILVKKKAA